MFPTARRGDTCARSLREVEGEGLSGSRERGRRGRRRCRTKKRRRWRTTGALGLRSPRWSRQEPTLSSSRCSASEIAHRLPVSPRRSKDGEEEEKQEEEEEKEKEVEEEKNRVGLFFVPHTCDQNNQRKKKVSNSNCHQKPFFLLSFFPFLLQSTVRLWTGGETQ